MGIGNDIIGEAKAKEREKLLKQVWKKVHKDYKGTFESGPNKGKKGVMVLRKGVTMIVPLDELTDAEIQKKI